MIYQLGTLTDPTHVFDDPDITNDSTIDVETDGKYLSLWFYMNDDSEFNANGVALTLREVHQLQRTIDSYLGIVYSDPELLAEQSRAAVARQ